MMKSSIRALSAAAGVLCVAAVFAQPATTTAKPGEPATPATSASGAAAVKPGEGKVWVNTTSKTYLCADSADYGKTQKGQYMTEAAAKAAGNRADQGKDCAK
jgi:hypothetical protein